VHDAYEKEAAAYWRLIGEKRARRRAKRAGNEQIARDDYVLTQPPVYSGPPKPVDPVKDESEAEPIAPKPIPVVSVFLKCAKEEFDFTPDAPASEIDYKRAYAKAAVAAGLTREQAVKVYGFESGGDGKYDVQAGLEYDTPEAHAISSALGYNQLLITNSVELLAEAGDQFVAALSKAADDATEPRRTRLQEKIAILSKMIAFTRTVADDWNEHARLAKLPKGLGVHALNLDVDVGPLLQAQKLATSVLFARRKDYTALLAPADLEMMNLTGDGNGLDMVVMPDALRVEVPTSNFFQRAGYVSNDVASENNTVAKLLTATNTKMDDEAKLRGAKDLAAAFDALH
jgi:hypothetical protein